MTHLTTIGSEATPDLHGLLSEEESAATFPFHLPASSAFPAYGTRRFTATSAPLQTDLGQGTLWRWLVGGTVQAT